MIHLAIDTATDILSVALRVSGEGRTATLAAVRDAGLRHTERLMTLVDRLIRDAGLRPAELDLVSCMRGPGSFTGLRIGMATAKGIASGLAGRRPIVSVPTLDVMAAAVRGAAIVLPVIDARKQRFYGAGYVNGGRVTDALDLAADDLLDAILAAANTEASRTSILVTGPHANEFVKAIELSGVHTVDLMVDPRARSGWALTLLDEAESTLERDGYDRPNLGPDYVRLSDAEIGTR